MDPSRLPFSLMELNQSKTISPADALHSLLAYCQANDWAGYDPYDALNSRLFKALPFLDARLPRLVLTQLLKRSPVNLRPLLLVPRTQNSKAMSLFLEAALKFPAIEAGEEDLVPFFVEKLKELRSPNSEFWCWGYSFPWQTRTIVVPRGTPNLVCTTFVASALLSAYESRRDPACLAMAASAAEYILRDLYWTGEDSIAGFSYPLPTVRAQIHNANFLAAALLCRVARHTGERKFIEPALRATRASAAKQRADGSWLYGELPKQAWIDNFHTGYNLSGLRGVSADAGTVEFEGNISRGFEFYRAHFFREDGAPRYFHDRTYPIDVHCVAQSLITLLEFKDYPGAPLEIANRVYRWAMANMRDEKGYFYYRVLPYCKIRTSYMRWSQAWMLLALATFCEQTRASARARVAVSSLKGVPA